MAWTDSRIFRQYLADVLDNTTSIDLGSDSFKAALYGNTITPSQDAAAALTGYNAAGSEWLTAGEKWQAGQWAQGGVALTGQSVQTAAGGIVYWAANNVSSGTATTLADVYGVLVYDDTVAAPVAKQGIMYVSFGGAQTVTNGMFTVQWPATGALRFTLPAG